MEAAAAEPTREHVAVELVVVHHQQADAAGLDRLGGRAQVLRHRRLELRRARRRIVARVQEHDGRDRFAVGREARVHQLERAARGGPHLLQVGHELLLAGVLDLVLEELRVADDLVQRSPQVVAEPGSRVDRENRSRARAADRVSAAGAVERGGRHRQA